MHILEIQESCADRSRSDVEEFFQTLFQIEGEEVLPVSLRVPRAPWTAVENFSLCAAFAFISDHHPHRWERIAFEVKTRCEVSCVLHYENHKGTIASVLQNSSDRLQVFLTLAYIFEISDDAPQYTRIHKKFIIPSERSKATGLEAPNKVPWKDTEIERLVRYCHSKGGTFINWRQVAEVMSGRSVKECREKYTKLKKSGKWIHYLDSASAPTMGHRKATLSSQTRLKQHNLESFNRLEPLVPQVDPMFEGFEDLLILKSWLENPCEE